MAYAFARLRFCRPPLRALRPAADPDVPDRDRALPAYYFFLLRLSEWTGGHVGLETYSGLILLLAGTGMAFYAWLFKGYIDSTPKELEEAAFVDGATRLQALRYVILPLVRPMIAVVFLLVFIATYSEYRAHEPRLHRRAGEVHAPARPAGLHLPALHRELGRSSRPPPSSARCR